MTDDHASADTASLAEIWAGLKAHLVDRFRELNSEIRHYPTPIARCDDQLPKLIEQRDHVRTELERMAALDAQSQGSAAPARDDIARYVRAATPSDDDTELRLRSRLETVLLAVGARRDA